MFLSEVDRKKYPDVKQKFRFELQNIEEINVVEGKEMLKAATYGCHSA